jgi:NAD(P)-dependent dehydrogenase (short-subunit alcohol dehydrogenase family)
MDTLRFDGQVAIVTGSGRGLGRSYALLLAERGAAVVVNDLDHGSGLRGDLPSAQRVADEIIAAGGKAVIDLHSVVDDAKGIVETATKEWGRVDIIVNNAGIAGGPPFEDASTAELNLMIDTHVKGSIGVTHAAWPYLAKRGGSVVNIISTGIFGSLNTAYSTAKAGLFGFTRSLAIYGGPAGVRVNGVAPQAWTSLAPQGQDSGLEQILASHFSTDLVAAFVIWLCHPDCSLTGECFSVGGGRTARISLGVARGLTADSPTPELYRDSVEELLSLSGSILPANGMEELRFSVNELGYEI